MNCFFLNVNKTYNRKHGLNGLNIESVKICCFKSVQYGSRFGVILTFVGSNYEININNNNNNNKQLYFQRVTLDSLH